MKNRCKNCKYFKRNTHRLYSDKYGECNCSKFMYGSSYEEECIKSTDNLLYQDYEGYSASLEVGEDFGCVHFEKNQFTVK